jgi:hypothetical protein
MGREIVTPADVQPPQAEGSGQRGALPPGQGAREPDAYREPDTYGDRLLKYVPAEVVTVFVFLAGAISAAGTNSPPWLIWGVFGLLLICTPLYLNRLQGVKKMVQLAISTVAFAVWVFSLGDEGPFGTLVWYKPIYGAVLLPLYTFIVPLVEPPGRAQTG